MVYQQINNAKGQVEQNIETAMSVLREAERTMILNDLAQSASRRQAIFNNLFRELKALRACLGDDR